MKTITDGRINLARWYAQQKGYTGRAGGWIYRPSGTPICQGYLELYYRYRSDIWNLIYNA